MQSSVSNYAFTVAFPIFEINGDVFLRASSDFSAWGVSPLDCGWLGFRQYCCCPRGFLVQVSNLCVSSQSLPFPAARGDHPSPLLSQMFISPPLFSCPLPAAPSGPPLLRGLHFYRPFFRDSPECLPVLLCVPSTTVPSVTSTGQFSTLKVLRGTFRECWPQPRSLIQQVWGRA